MRSAAILFLASWSIALLPSCSVEERDFSSVSGGSGGGSAASSGAGGAVDVCEGSCDDGDACTDDICEAGTCVNTPTDIDDKNVCTTDLCDTQTGPSHTPIAVDDSDPCTDDTCDADSGPQHTPVVVDDSDPCTADACDSKVGVTHMPIFDPTMLILREVSIGSPDYVIIENASTCPNSTEGLRIAFEDTIGSDLVTMLPAQVLPPKGTLKITDAANPPLPEVYAGGAISFDPTSGGWALLCNGLCTTVTNVIDGIVYSIGEAAPALPAGVTFAPVPLEGISTQSQAKASFHRVATAGVAPSFLASDWLAGQPCDIKNLQIVEVFVGTNEHVVIKNPTFCPLSLAGLQIFLDDPSLADTTFALPAQVMAPGEAVRLVQSGAVGNEINIGAISFAAARSGNALLCNGACDVAANVIDAMSFDGGEVHPPLPAGVTFAPTGATGITAMNESSMSFVRVGQTGAAPDFKKSDWSTRDRCLDQMNLRFVEMNIGTDFVRLENPAFCAINLSGLNMLFDDSSGVDATFALPAQTLAAGARVTLRNNAGAGEINVPPNIPFSATRGGATILCVGACSAASGTNVIDVVAFSTGEPHPPLPAGITFSGGGLLGITSVTQNTTSWRRGARAGSNPTFFGSDWFVAPSSQ